MSQIIFYGLLTYNKVYGKKRNVLENLTKTQEVVKMSPTRNKDVTNVIIVTIITIIQTKTVVTERTNNSYEFKP